MDLPPWTYGLLMGTTLLAIPFLWHHGLRRSATLASWLGVLWLGLALLFYSTWLCWPLAVAAAAGLGHQAKGRWGLLLALPALGFGIAFQAMDSALGFAIYFGIGLPIALGVPMMAALSALAPFRLPLVATLASTSLVTFIPLSSFGLDFLVSFELMHVGWLVVALIGIVALERVQTPPLVDHYAAWMPPSSNPRRLWPLALAIAALIPVAVTLPTNGTVPPGLRPWLVASGVAGALLMSAGLRELGRLRRHRRSIQLADQMPTLTPQELGRAQPLAPEALTVPKLQSILNRASLPDRQIIVKTRFKRPFEHLSDDVLEWLYDQTGPRIIHVAVEEGSDLFVEPAPVRLS